MNTKIFTLLIVGMVAFTINTAVFSAEDYNSSRSNTSTAIVDQKIGDILLRYGIGGVEINEVTDALAVGISEIDLKVILMEIGTNEEGIQEIFTELDLLGVGDITQSASATGIIQIKDPNGGTVASSDTEDTPQSTTEVIKILTPEREVSISDDIEDISPLEAKTGTIKEISPTKQVESVSNINKLRENDKSVVRNISERTKYSNITLERTVFQEASKNIIQNIRSAEPEERKNLISELQVSRKTFQTEIVSMNLSIRENAKVLRDNFREIIKVKWSRDNDSIVYGRIALAHGKGLKMLNRFRSATARFDHILGRLESRIEKFEAQGADVSSIVLLIEKAKNMSVENEGKMEELKAKYELLLLGENPRGIAEEARMIAKELKTEIENLQAIIVEAYTEGKKI